MTASGGFVSGLCDFLLAPIRLYSFHRRLIRLNLNAKHSKAVHEQHLQHTQRLRLRERTHNSYVSSSSPTVTRSEPSSSGSRSQSPIYSGGLFQPLLRMWLLNAGLILFLALISAVCEAVFTRSTSTYWIFKSSSFLVLSNMGSMVLHICLPLFMELVNMLYLKQICDRIALIGETSNRSSALSAWSSSEQTNPILSATIMDRAYALVFFVIFQLQWNLLCHLSSNYRINQLINIFAIAFMYACYAIEYRWRLLPRRTFEGFLKHVLNQWTYFVGYGFLLGLGYQQWPEFIGKGGMLLAISYPILVIGALCSPRPNMSTADDIGSRLYWVEQKLLRLFRLPLILSMYPALFLTNLIVRGCVGAAYQLWF